MILPKDEEILRNVPSRSNRNAYGHTQPNSSANENTETIREVYQKCYTEVAGEVLAAHKGYISDTYTQSVIHKDMQQISRRLDEALLKHLKDTNGYIGAFPTSQQYYATEDKTKDHYFHYFGMCHYDINYPLKGPLQNLNRMVYKERFQSNATKSTFALVSTVICIALMWLFQSWFFVYQGLELLKIAALSAVFVAMLALLWWTSDDPYEFALQNSFEESPAVYLGLGVVAAVLVRIFLSGTTAATVCCAITALCGPCFLVRILAARKRLRIIRNRGPALRELSAWDRQRFEEEAVHAYRFVRFLELWHDYEKPQGVQRHVEAERRVFMDYIKEYDQWCSQYLTDDEDTGF